MELKFAKRNIALAEALESGDYKQTTGSLRDEHGFCCLGVACDLYKKASKKGKWDAYFAFKLGDEVAEGMPPPQVALWYGWNEINPELKIGTSVTGASYHNDDGHRTFKQIAKAFRRLAKELEKQAA